MNYIIINKDTLEKRIEELEIAIKTLSLYPLNLSDRFIDSAKIEALKEILSQSTPLIPEIEKAFMEGKNSHWQTEAKHYISNLKLDI